MTDEKKLSSALRVDFARDEHERMLLGRLRDELYASESQAEIMELSDNVLEMLSAAGSPEPEFPLE